MMTYKELQDYFHGRELPKEIRGEHIIFKDLPLAVAMNFEKIESELERHGPKGVKKSALAGAAKARLNEIVRILEG